MKPNKPIRIDKSFAFDDVSVNEQSTIPTITIKGYASRMYDEDRKLVIDADNESVDTMGIDLSRLKSGNLPLLYGHDQKSAVGKIVSAEYKADGLVIEAIVYKLPNDTLTNYAYEAVKAGIITSFSVGIIVEDFDIVEQDGNDYLQLAKSTMIETSLVAVPSNAQATFQISQINDGAEKSFSTIISKSVLKQENPNACKEFGECVLSTKSVKTEDKGLTYYDTAKESWVKSQDFYKALDILKYTIEDNWYSEQYWDEISPEEALLNVKSTFASFTVEFEKLIIDGDDITKGIKETTNLKGNEMVTKDVVEEGKENPEVIATEETKDEKIPEEIKQDPKEEPKVEEPKVEPTKVEEASKEEKETPAEIPEVPVRTLAELMGDVSNIKVDELEETDLEIVYESVTGVVELIETMVKDQVKTELE